MQGLLVENRMRIHASMGIICCVFFAEFSFIAKSEFSFRFSNDTLEEKVHNTFVYIFVPCIILVGIGGVWTRYWM